MTRSLVQRITRRVTRLILGRLRDESPIEVWNRRARQYGPRAVFNLVHGEDELDQVTAMQKRAIYPHVLAELRGDERLALDFGCGPGRFTADLANMIHGRAIGVDTTRAFIDMAPRVASVEYRVMTAGQIPVDGGQVDLLWICLVLGGIDDRTVLESSIRELNRVLTPGGLVVLVENTSERNDAPHWTFRSVSEYQRLLEFVALEHKGDYEDAAERISIMVGRKSVSVTDGGTPALSRQ